MKRFLNRNDFNFESRDIEQPALDTRCAEPPLRSVHYHAVSRMPWHQSGDPFSRLLLAQAIFLPAG